MSTNFKLSEQNLFLLSILNVNQRHQLPWSSGKREWHVFNCLVMWPRGTEKNWHMTCNSQIKYFQSKFCRFKEVDFRIGFQGRFGRGGGRYDPGDDICSIAGDNISLIAGENIW